jgi:hypothetical protein
MIHSIIFCYLITDLYTRLQVILSKEKNNTLSVYLRIEKEEKVKTAIDPFLRNE